MDNIVVTAFGRFNPPTIGHFLLIERVAAEAQSRGADAVLFASQTVSPPGKKEKKDPIPFKQKVDFLQRIVDENGLDLAVHQDTDVNTFIVAAKYLNGPNLYDEDGYDEMVYVAGRDRVSKSEELLNKYNSVEYTYDDKIEVVESGARDMDDGDDDLSGDDRLQQIIVRWPSMSYEQRQANAKATYMREFAKRGLKEHFILGLPTTNEALQNEIWDATRLGLGLEEKLTESERVLREQQAELQFDLIESVVEELAQSHGVDSEYLWEELDQFSDQELLEFAEDAKKYKSPSGGLTKKGRDHYNKTTGSNLKAPVTTPPSKLKRGSKPWKRRKSFCARMGGVKKNASAETRNDPDSRVNLALKKWNC